MKKNHLIKYPNILLNMAINVIPVNPTLSEVLGRKAYPTIADIPEKVEHMK
jgi:uncharacterized protein